MAGIVVTNCVCVKAIIKKILKLWFTQSINYQQSVCVIFFMLSSAVLINELQLGTRLNHAIDHVRRGEFALLLALSS